MLIYLYTMDLENFMTKNTNYFNFKVIIKEQVILKHILKSIFKEILKTQKVVNIAKTWRPHD